MKIQVRVVDGQSPSRIEQAINEVLKDISGEKVLKIELLPYNAAGAVYTAIIQYAKD